MSEQSFRSTPSGGRLAMLILGALAILFAAVILSGAGFLHWADGRRDADGYYTTPEGRFQIDSFALTTSDVEIDEDLLSALGADRLRVDVRSNNRKPVFVGVGPATAVASYLAGAGHAILEDVDFDPFRPTYYQTGGGEPPAPPADQNFWLAAVEGDGEQSLRWDPRDGAWAIAVLNADGSAVIDVTVRAGANVPLVGQLAWIVTIVGLAVLALGLLLVVLGVRRRMRPSSPGGSASAA